MTRKQLPSVFALLIGTTLASTMLAAESQRSAAPVQEDPLLKTVEPGGGKTPKRERVPGPSERMLDETSKDSNVQQDPLLKMIEPNSQTPESVEKQPVKSGKKAQSKKAIQEKPTQEKETKKKSSKVQEDPLLQMLDQK